ncbi:hypothetical protein SBA1_1480012 [Candidatus Sulfotelmatobacter kueseliae]|uniref:Uncharacterized protein n=1 Tax=Candidatus Sulfotelmatobacter kueseliae TaxID=2042962 RepID=A0A2U3K8J9_9BACT|nr:hypothetical protein SBA1_1480012 [Candidatus Sulfotelmatobacter kueseliae]
MLDPRVHNPAARISWNNDLSSGANPALSELVAEFEKRPLCFGVTLRLGQGGKALDGGLKGRHAGKVYEIFDCRFSIAD